MSYYQIHDIKRDRLPYAYDAIWIRPTWVTEITNKPLENLKKVSVFTIGMSTLVESCRHISGTFSAINHFYEYPKNSLQWSIYAREIFRVPGFYSEWRKKLVYGAVQHTLDSGFKIAMFKYIFGGTWSPFNFSDYNSAKYLIFSLVSAASASWTQYPLAVARKAYYADISWDESLRKGYRSPLHALLKIPFTEGPAYLFRGGLLHCFGNTLGLGSLFYIYVWMKDKFSFTWRYCDVDYRIVKFIILGLAFSFHVFGQGYFYMRHMMDTCPKERGGNVTFGSTMEAARWFKHSWTRINGNITHGYWRWFKEYGAVLFGTIWFADNIGLMDNFKADANSYETTIAGFITD